MRPPRPLRRPWLKGAVLAGAVVTCALLAGCGSAPPVYEPTGIDTLEIPTPSPDPADFVAEVDNPWLALTPGARWRYLRTATGRPDVEVEVSVPGETRDILGVTATLVRTTESVDGQVGTTRDAWVAQDTAGNVWMLAGDGPTGESWQAGEDGALAGLVMPAEPRLGDGWLEQQAPGIAEDRVEVLGTRPSLGLPAGEYGDVLVLRHTAEPGGAVEERSYAQGTGLVLAEGTGGTTVLVDDVREPA